VKGGEDEMAQATLVDTNLRLVFEAGVNEQGKPVYKNKTYSNVQMTATTDQLFQAATALAALSSDTFYTIERNDRSDIMV
jgi:hypothetical protein